MCKILEIKNPKFDHLGHFLCPVNCEMEDVGNNTISSLG